MPGRRRTVPQSHAPSLTARRCPSDAPARGRSGRTISTALARMATGRRRRRRRSRSRWSKPPGVVQSGVLGCPKTAHVRLLAVLCDPHHIPAIGVCRGLLTPWPLASRGDCSFALLRARIDLLSCQLRPIAAYVVGETPPASLLMQSAARPAWPA